MKYTIVILDKAACRTRELISGFQTLKRRSGRMNRWGTGNFGGCDTILCYTVMWIHDTMYLSKLTESHNTNSEP